MLSAIFSAVGGQLVDSLLGRVTGLFEAYFKKQISEAELRTKLHMALLETVREVEKAHADALAKTYASFMDAMKQSLLLQVVWAAVTLSQLFVLLWHQFGIPYIVYYMREAGNGDFRYPSSGTTVEWSYLLLAACVGMGPVVLRSGPGVGTLTDRLKQMIK